MSSKYTNLKWNLQTLTLVFYVASKILIATHVWWEIYFSPNKGLSIKYVRR